MYNSELNDDGTKKVDTINSNINENNTNNNIKSVFAGEEVVLDDEVDKNTTKKLINKKIIIGVICLVAIIICVIVYAVYIKVTSNNDIDNELPDESALLVTPKDTYEGLNYTSNKVVLQEIGFFYNHSKNIEGSKIELSYISIDGLKDEQLENKINNYLEEEVNKLYTQENIQNEKVLYDHVYNATDVFVFNNVLSTLYCKEVCDIDGNITYTYKGINLNLKKFEEFNINDVFTNTTKVEDLLNDDLKAIYSSDKFTFCISPKFIYIPNGKNIEKINLYENMDKVAIYKRYSDGKKIFNKTFNATPYVFTTKKFFETDLYGVSDNIFIDTCNNIVDLDINDNIKQAANNLYKNVVNKVRNIAYSNSSKRYLVQIISNVKKDEDGFYDIKVEYNLYELSKEFFNDNISNFVVASENKEDDEYSVANYFVNPVMGASEYLESMQTDSQTIKVDENGKEKEEDIELEIGVS